MLIVRNRVRRILLGLCLCKQSGVTDVRVHRKGSISDQVHMYYLPAEVYAFSINYLKGDPSRTAGLGERDARCQLTQMYRVNHVDPTQPW